jgi:signal transduction histidine kinase
MGEAQKGALVEAAPVGVGLVHPDGVLAAANPEFGRLLGVSIETAVNSPLDVVASSGDPAWRDIVSAARETPDARRWTLSLGGQAGSRSVEVVAWGPKDRRAQPIVTILVSELGAVGASSTSIREHERARIAREIHDGLAQELWLAKLAASKLARDRGLGAAGRALCADLLRSIDAAMSEAQTAVMARMSVHEPTISMADLIERQVDEFSDRFGIRADCEIEDVDNVSPPMAVEILRIVQEALNNARKHANARRVVVRLKPQGSWINVSVADDGEGFDPTVQSTGFGRRSMQERAESLGARLTIVSAPGSGTNVKLRVPVDPAGTAS